MKIVFATRNHHKVKEIQALLPSSIELLSLDETGILEEIPENEQTISANAISKARYVFEKYGLNCFADDSGLEVTALNGEPGVYSARYAGPKKNDQANTAYLLHNLLEKLDRSAQFRTVIALIIEGELQTFEGIVRGEIIHQPKGKQGFGYDPVFLPDGEKRTFAEMELPEKNKISHRAIALKKMRDFLQDKYISH